MLMTWPAYFFLVINFLFNLILSCCRVTLLGAIVRIITILDYKRFAANIIFSDTEATLCAEKFINAHLVQVLLIADHRFE